MEIQTSPHIKWSYPGYNRQLTGNPNRYQNSGPKRVTKTQEPTKNETKYTPKSENYRNITKPLWSITSLYWPITADHSTCGEIIPDQVSYSWSALRLISLLAACCRTPIAYSIGIRIMRWEILMNQYLLANLPHQVVRCIYGWPTHWIPDHAWYSIV